MGDVGTALAEEPIHEGGLAVVDVGDHRHVAEPGGVQRALLCRAGSGGRRNREGGEAAERRLRGVVVAARNGEGGSGGEES